jgi:hypothetical protein
MARGSTGVIDTKFEKATTRTSRGIHTVSVIRGACGNARHTEIKTAKKPKEFTE